MYSCLIKFNILLTSVKEVGYLYDPTTLSTGCLEKLCYILSMLIPCQFCGQQIERANQRKNASCFNCKKEKRQEHILRYKRQKEDRKKLEKGLEKIRTKEKTIYFFKDTFFPTLEEALSYKSVILK